MLRHILLTFLFALLLRPVFAQYIIYQQDFEDTAFHFNSCVLSNIDGGIPASAAWQNLADSAWIIRQPLVGATRAAVATSNYNPAKAADDWFITPAVQLGKASKLYWDAMSLTQGKPDAYQVYISNSNQSVNGCLINPPVFAIQAEQTSAYATHSIDLAELGYSGQPVYIGFRLNTSSGGDLLAIDNIRVVDDSITGIVTLNFVLNVKDYDSLISADTGFVDIVGNFNNWDGTNYRMQKTESDSNVYRISIPGFHDGQLLEFKFRINGSWHHDTIEFPYGSANRTWLIEPGKYTYNACYNKQGEVYGIPESDYLSAVKVFPNPFTDILQLSGTEPFSLITLITPQGKEMLRVAPGGNQRLLINTTPVSPGLYILVFYQKNRMVGSLKVIK